MKNQRSPRLSGDVSRREKMKDYANIIQSLVTAIAIIIAGIWFILSSEAAYKAKISQVVSHQQINKDWNMVNVFVKISNLGKRCLHLNCGTFRIQGILPITSLEDKNEYNGSLNNRKLKTADWPVVPGRKDMNGRDVNEYEKKPLDIKIEPGEDDIINIDFIIPTAYQTVRIYSYLKRERSFWEKIWKSLGIDQESDYGWPGISIYNLTK